MLYLPGREGAREVVSQGEAYLPVSGRSTLARPSEGGALTRTRQSGRETRRDILCVEPIEVVGVLECLGGALAAAAGHYSVGAPERVEAEGGDPLGVPGALHVGQLPRPQPSGGEVVLPAWRPGHLQLVPATRDPGAAQRGETRRPPMPRKGGGGEVTRGDGGSAPAGPGLSDG
eukprot:767660-Prorocentrum_minimum.AAC.10